MRLLGARQCRAPTWSEGRAAQVSHSHRAPSPFVVKFAWAIDNVGMANSDIVILILAAGNGTRLKSALAKVLHRAGGRSLVEHVVRAC
jgi:hypothetical protein